MNLYEVYAKSSHITALYDSCVTKSWCLGEMGKCVNALHAQPLLFVAFAFVLCIVRFKFCDGFSDKVRSVLEFGIYICLLANIVVISLALRGIA